MKQVRIVNLSLLAAVRLLPCLCCGVKREVTHPHHVKTVKSGGDDVESNLMPLCPEHHTEVHKRGLDTFSRTYPAVLFWLQRYGWQKLMGKWRSP